MKSLGRCPACGKPLTILNVGVAALKWGVKAAALVGALSGRPLRGRPPLDPQWMRRCVLCQQMR